jgi:hypothetical protein
VHFEHVELRRIPFGFDIVSGEVELSLHFLLTIFEGLLFVGIILLAAVAKDVHKVFQASPEMRLLGFCELADGSVKENWKFFFFIQFVILVNLLSICNCC